MNEELRPCPFSGEMPIGQDDRYMCSTLGCVMQEDTISAKEWNTRPIEDALTARIAELKDVLEKVYDEWITCDDDWWTEEVDELKEKAARILKNLPEVQE